MQPKVWGHRGCRGSGNPPENSLSAFELAINAGASGIEFDVFLAKDGVPVVFHDSTLDRMVGVSGLLSALTVPEIKKFHLLTVEGRTSRETIPTMVEVLDLVDHHRRSCPTFVINIELKDPHSVAGVAQLLQQRLAQGWTNQNFLVSSFEMEALREFQSLLPAIPRGTLFDCAASGLPAKIAETGDLQPSTINVPAGALTPAALAVITAAGATPVIWTPNETNPDQLSQLERENLIQSLRRSDFVTITDFPKELLHWLKPSKTRATAAGVLAACLAYNQQDMLFHPTESGLESLKSPSEYPELEHLGFHELTITAVDGISLIVWERPAAPGRPHFLLFHGNRAHWGDTGSGDVTGDRRARLKFLRELASSGNGVTAVTLRGFGKSSATPSETGFLLDLQAVADHIISLGINPRNLVVAGESLGTWAATQTAVYLTQRNSPPALLSLQNPFTSAAEVGEAVVSHFPIVRSLGIGLSASSLDRHVLKSHFYTANLIKQLTPLTRVHIATSGKDRLVDPSHSDRLSDVARRSNLRVVRDIFPEAFHSTIPPIEYAHRLTRLGAECSEGNSSETSQLWGEPYQATPTVDQTRHL